MCAGYANGMWYIVDVTEIPRNPYWKFGVNSKGQVFQNMAFPGIHAAAISAFLAPTQAQTREALLRIRRRARISRGQLASVLGVGVATLGGWETGVRRPCLAAPKLVQLTEALFFSDDILRDGGYGGLVINQLDEKAMAVVKADLQAQAARTKHPTMVQQNQVD